MKKLLALVLALVMTLSLCVTSNAAYDGEEYDYDEAVEVMSAIGVFQGDENGKFNGKDVLTREQAAKIVTYMLLGKKSADALVTIAAPFADVEATRWSAGSIAYCYNEGILAGVGNGQFAPTAQLTGLAFAKMMLTALGYNAENEGLTGANWSINAAKLALTIGLTKGMDDVALSAPMTREQAAKMALNTEKATLVDYPNASVVKVGDIEVSTSAKASAVTTANDTNKIAADGKVQFAEQYAKDLRLQAGYADTQNRYANYWTLKSDEIGTYAKTADKTLVVEKFGKTFADMAKTINSKYTFKAGTIVHINGNDTGVSPTGNNAQVGDVMEIYLNDDTANQVDLIVVTRYDGAKVTSKVATKTVDGVDYVRVPGIMNTYSKASKVHGYEDLAKDDIVYVYTSIGNGAAENTEYFFAKAESFEGKITAIKTQSSSTPSKFTIDGADKMVNQSAGAVANMTTDGIAADAVANYNTAYKFYTDANGFIVYAEQVEDTLSDYVAIKAISMVSPTSGVDAKAYAEARIIKMDGTTEVVKIASINGYKPVLAGGANVNALGTFKAGTTYTFTENDSGAAIDALPVGTTAVGTGTAATAIVAGNFYAVSTVSTGDVAAADKYVAVSASVTTNAATKLDDTFYTYTIASDGNYELKHAASYGSVTVTQAFAEQTSTITGGAVANNGITVNDKTVFVVNNKLDGTSNSYTVYNGKAEVPSMTTATWTYVTKDGVAAFVLVKSYATKTSTGNSVYFLQNSTANLKYTTVKRADNTTYQYADVKAIVNGEITTVKVTASNNAVSGFAFTVGELIDPTFNADGIISAKAACPEDKAVAYGYELTEGTLVTKAGNVASYVCAEDAVVYYKDIDGNYTTGTMADYVKDANDAIYVVVKDDAVAAGKKVVAYAYIEEILDGGLDTLAYDLDATYAGATALDETAIINDIVVNAGSTVTVFVKATSVADTVKFSENGGTTYVAKTGTDAGKDYFTMSAPVAGNTTVLVEITTGSVKTVYQVRITVAQKITFVSGAQNNLDFGTVVASTSGAVTSNTTYVAAGETVTVTLTGTATADKTMQIKNGGTVLGSVDVAAGDTSAVITFVMPETALTLTIAAV